MHWIHKSAITGLALLVLSSPRMVCEHIPVQSHTDIILWKESDRYDYQVHILPAANNYYRSEVRVDHKAKGIRSAQQGDTLVTEDCVAFTLVDEAKYYLGLGVHKHADYTRTSVRFR
jgi:hypothetical protein